MKYSTLERVPVGKTVDKIKYIQEQLNQKCVLDIGAFDETAIDNKSKEQLMHYIIAKIAKQVDGIDTSEKLPKKGIKTTENSYIYKGDLNSLVNEKKIKLSKYDIVFAGELIEHLENTSEFLKLFSQNKDLKGKKLYLTTPNGMGMYNFFLGLIKRESNHPDHLQMYTYKTLNTLCLRAGFRKWEILPYHVSFPEMINSHKGCQRIFTILFQKIINFLEKLFPLLAGGWIVKIYI